MHFELLFPQLFLIDLVATAIVGICVSLGVIRICFRHMVQPGKNKPLIVDLNASCLLCQSRSGHVSWSVQLVFTRAVPLMHCSQV